MNREKNAKQFVFESTSNCFAFFLGFSTRSSIIQNIYNASLSRTAGEGGGGRTVFADGPSVGLRFDVVAAFRHQRRTTYSTIGADGSAGGRVANMLTSTDY